MKTFYYTKTITTKSLSYNQEQTPLTREAKGSKYNAFLTQKTAKMKPI